MGIDCIEIKNLCKIWENFRKKKIEKLRNLVAFGCEVAPPIRKLKPNSSGKRKSFKDIIEHEFLKHQKLEHEFLASDELFHWWLSFYWWTKKNEKNEIAKYFFYI